MTRKKLGEICNPKQWKTISSDILTEKGYPVYGANGVIGYYSDYNHAQSTLLITCRGATCGSLNVCQPFSYVNGNAMALDDLSNEISIKYLYYYLLVRGLSDVITGSAQPQIVRQSLVKVVIEYPSLSEQHEITTTLDKIHCLIAKRKQQLKKLDLLVKAKFYEMFGEYDLHNRNDDWLAIGSLAEVVGGSTPKTEIAEYWNGEYLWITPAEIDENSFVIKKTQRQLTEAGVKSCSLRPMPAGTVLLSSRAPIGKVAIAGVEMFCNQGFKNLICSDKLNPVFVYYLLKFNTEYLNSLGRGATFKEISKSIVENIHIPVPNRNIQNEFARFVERTEKVKSKLKLSLEKLELLKQSLLQKYFG